MLRKIVDAASPALARFPDICALGVSVAGKVDPAMGTTQADNLRWINVPVRDILARLTSLPVAIDNDAQCALIAEWQSGACVGSENVAYLTYGTGVGGGIIINGRPYRGRSHAGAELGHVITHANGRLCNCGHKGCYETYASTTALKRLLRNQFSVKEIIEGAKNAVPQFEHAFELYIHEVALGLASIMAVLSPDVLVLGGGLSNAGDFFLHAVHRKMAAFEPWLTDPTQIVLAHYGNDAGVIGAAAIASMAVSSNYI